MNGKLAFTTIVAACALCLALVGCGGGSTSSSEASSSAAESSASSVEASSSATSESDAHASYFVGTWDLYESDEYTHEQIEQVMEQYANDEDVRAQINEAYGRDNVEFCARFNADGTGELDTGAEIVPFTWEATNEGAVTFTSFNGKETALHIPVIDGKITLNNGDTYAKAS